MDTIPFFPPQAENNASLADANAIALALGNATNSNVITQSLVFDGITSFAAGLGIATANDPVHPVAYTDTHATATGGNILSNSSFDVSGYANNLAVSASADFSASLWSVGYGDWY